MHAFEYVSNMHAVEKRESRMDPLNAECRDGGRWCPGLVLLIHAHVVSEWQKRDASSNIVAMSSQLLNKLSHLAGARVWVWIRSLSGVRIRPPGGARNSPTYDELSLFPIPLSRAFR